MNLRNKIYFSPLGYLIHAALVIVAAFGKRCMVYGYWNSEGKYLPKCRISSKALILEKKKLKIEDNVWINHYARIDTTCGVEIGEGCQIGYGACILSHSSHNAIRLLGTHYMEIPIMDRAGYIFKPVKIGKYTFVGGGSCIMPGVTIGKGCVIGVNSVVTHDIPDYSIAMGNPARVTGSTLDTDRKYLAEDPELKEMYYDDEAIQNLRLFEN